MIGAARRLLLVHAHPDDETIGTGATMAHYAAAGAQVSLVTCTLGEEGEILVPELAQLAADQADQLGGWRIPELTAAMAELGVTDHRFLGGAGRFRDSGMIGRSGQRAAAGVLAGRYRDPAVFAAAVDRAGRGDPRAAPAGAGQLRRAAAATATPTTSWRTGSRMAAVPRPPTRAFRRPAGPGRSPSSTGRRSPRSVAEAGLRALAAAETPFQAGASRRAAAGADELVTTAISAAGVAAAKRRALAAHATQVTVHGQFYALSNDIGQPVPDTEYYRLVAGPAGGARGTPQGRETDLFGGLADGCDRGCRTGSGLQSAVPVSRAAAAGRSAVCWPRLPDLRPGRGAVRGPTRCCWCRPGRGATLVPIAPVLAIASNVGLPAAQPGG